MLCLSGRGDKDVESVGRYLGMIAMTTPHRRPLRRLREGKPPGARDLHHGRRSRSRHRVADPRGAAGGRRRSDRAWNAVLRPDGRWSGHPGGGPARARRGQTLNKTLAMVAEFRKTDHDDADRPDGLLQPDLHPRRRRLHRRRAGGRRRRADRRRPAARGRCRALRAGARGRAQFHPPRDAHHRRSPPAGRAARTPPASSTTCR